MEKYESHGFLLKKDSDLTPSVVKCVLQDEILHIPAEVDGTPLQEICYGFFVKLPCRKIILEEGIRIVSGDAFVDCPNLEEVVFPSSIQKVGFQSFCNCPSLRQLLLPEDGSLQMEGYSIVRDGTTLVSVHNGISFDTFSVRDGIKSIGRFAFSEVRVRRVELPESISELEEYAFNGCFAEEILLPATLRKIGGSAFSSCRNLQHISLPNSISSISTSAFSGCNALSTVLLPDGLANIKNNAFSYCSSLSTLEIPDTVESMDTPFENAHIQRVSLYPSTLHRFNSPFSGCYLHSWEFADCNNVIPEKIFIKVHGPECLNIPEYIHEIGKQAFRLSDNIKTLLIPGSVRVIGEQAFCRSHDLTKVVINEGVEEIHAHAFAGCKNLRSIYLPSTLRRIDSPGHFFAILEDVMYSDWAYPESFENPWVVNQIFTPDKPVDVYVPRDSFVAEMATNHFSGENIIYTDPATSE